MAIGGIMGMSQDAVPDSSVEQLVIALSVLILGLAVACDWEAPIPVAIAVVSVFAIFHGYAHAGKNTENRKPGMHMLSDSC